jgi:hypothetical protein
VARLGLNYKLEIFTWKESNILPDGDLNLHCSEKKQISESIGEEVPWRGNFQIIRGNDV